MQKKCDAMRVDAKRWISLQNRYENCDFSCKHLEHPFATYQPLSAPAGLFFKTVAFAPAGFLKTFAFAPPAFAFEAFSLEHILSFAFETFRTTFQEGLKAFLSLSLREVFAT